MILSTIPSGLLILLATKHSWMVHCHIYYKPEYVVKRLDYRS